MFEKGSRFRAAANGYALGSGNSIPDYVPVDGYLAMIEAAKKIRKSEKFLKYRDWLISEYETMQHFSLM